MNLHGSPIDVIQQAFRLWNIDVLIAGSIEGVSSSVAFDLRDASLPEMGRALNAMTHCYFVPINAHSVLVVQDDKRHREQYERIVTATIEVPNIQGGDKNEGAEVVGILNALFGIRDASFSGHSVTIRAPLRDAIQAENIVTHLFQPESEVLLDVRAYLVTAGHNRNLGFQLPQQISIFNVDSAAQGLIAENASIVQELIAAGAVSAGDTLGIAEALVAGGYASNSVLGSSFVTLGGGSTTTGIEFGSVNADANLSLSSNRQIRDATLRLETGQTGTLKIGERYPVMTSSTKVLGGSAAGEIPTITYEDLGLTLEATPHIDATGEVRLHIHESYRSLDGVSLNNIPIIENQEFQSDFSVPSGLTTVIVSSVNTTESRTRQGVIAFLPSYGGLNKQTADLVVTVTPRLTRARIPSK